MSATVCSRRTEGLGRARQRERQNGCGWMEGWAGGRDCDRRQVRERETAGERDEAWRKKTVNEAFLEA